MARSTTLAGTLTNSMDAGITMLTAGIEVDGEVLDETAWGEGFTGLSVGVHTWGGTFEGFITAKPADPGTLGNFALSDGTNSVTWTGTAYIDTWTLHIKGTTVTVSGHITCNAAPAFAP